MNTSIKGGAFLSSRQPNCTYCGLPIYRNLEVEFNGKLYHPNHIPKEQHAKSKRLSKG
jgi:hypothetical protein